jgi:hypothetical protein
VSEWADAGRARVAGLALGDVTPERLEPPEVAVEAVEHEPLELGVAVGRFGAEELEVAVAPDDAAREQHRAAGPVALLEHRHVRPELARVGGGAQPGHAGAGYDQVWHRRLRSARSPACARRTRA